ncbi:MAG: hypothetical protein ACI9G1_001196 [Pirellulaceae bacterium]|jgi:hypothetical protein
MSRILNRRDALGVMSSGFGALAFAAMASEQTRAAGAPNPLVGKQPHFAARAKRVIFLSMRGAPSHVDTFDYKPQLTKDSGKRGNYGGGNGTLLGSPWEFKQHGRSGQWISSLLPHLSKHADELCLLKGMHCDQPNHSQATVQAHTGSFQFVRPSLGAWSVYGLGTENTNLPGFIVLNPQGGAANFGSAFLPAAYQGTQLGASVRGQGRGAAQTGESPQLPNIKNSQLSAKAQRIQLDFIQELNRSKLQKESHQPQVEGMIQSFELAFKMQTTMPELVDLSKETQATKELYGIGAADTTNFGTQCLLARRMMESGVRFVELTNGSWDHHNDLKAGMETQCGQIDKPIAGLLTDLKRRDLLKDTLVIWAGEFGRTPHGQGGDGRDHNNKGYTTFMAGGGVKGGLSYGATDDYGYEAVAGKMHIHDWHATILHLMGLDHQRLTFRHAGRDFRLTDVHGKVAKDILA